MDKGAWQATFTGLQKFGHNLATKKQQGREIMSCSIYSEKCETQSDNSL